MPEFLDLGMVKRVVDVESELTPALCDDWDEKDPTVLNNTELNCLYNIAGYIVSRVENNDKVCNECVSSVCSREPINTNYSAYVALKEWKAGSLKIVTEHCFEFFLEIEKTFRSLKELLLKNQKLIVLKKITDKVERFKFGDCHPMKSKMLNRYVEFRCKNLGSLRTKGIKKKSEKGAYLKAS